MIILLNVCLYCIWGLKKCVSHHILSSLFCVCVCVIYKRVDWQIRLQTTEKESTQTALKANVLLLK